MSETKFTPGPWTYSVDGCAKCCEQGRQEFVIDGPPRGYHGQFSNEADARLIAAAPVGDELADMVLDVPGTGSRDLEIDVIRMPSPTQWARICWKAQDFKAKAEGR